MIRRFESHCTSTRSTAQSVPRSGPPRDVDVILVRPTIQCKPCRSTSSAPRGSCHLGMIKILSSLHHLTAHSLSSPSLGPPPLQTADRPGSAVRRVPWRQEGPGNAPSARSKNSDLPSEGPQVPWRLGGNSRIKGRLADLLLQRRVTAESTRALFVLKEVSLLLVFSLSLSLASIHCITTAEQG